jgi:predicted nicotinamide N-methyase
LFDAVKKLTRIKSPFFIPEIKLHCVVPQEERYPFVPTEFNCMYGYPTWSGIALARFILDNANAFKGLRITDIGCGSGVATIAACMAGAEVTAIDQDVASLYFTKENCELNGVSPEIVWGTFRDIETQYVMMSSLFYSSANHGDIKQMIDRKNVIIGGYMPESFEQLPKTKVNTPKEMYVFSNYLAKRST